MRTRTLLTVAGVAVAAKAVAGVWQVPLLRLDFGSMYNKYIGESESNMRQALNTAEVMAPCVLWIDELEKGIAVKDNDDGTLNYERGLFATVARFTSELDISTTNQMFGAFARVEGYYDPMNVNGRTDHRELSRAARDQIAKNLRLLDLYGELNVSPGEIDTTVRGGRQVISWGESTFIPGGINVINPVDVSQLRTPGAELRNALLPQGMVSVNAAVTDNVSVEGFYQYDWKEVRLPPVGSYFSINDGIGPEGTNFLMLGDGLFSDLGTDLDEAFGLPDGTLGFDPDFFKVPGLGRDRPRDQGGFLLRGRLGRLLRGGLRRFGRGGRVGQRVLFELGADNGSGRIGDQNHGWCYSPQSDSGLLHHALGSQGEVDAGANHGDVHLGAGYEAQVRVARFGWTFGQGDGLDDLALLQRGLAGSGTHLLHRQSAATFGPYDGRLGAGGHQCRHAVRGR